MDWDIVLGFIDPTLFIVIVLIWCLGLFLKKAPLFKEEWMIPFILLAIAIVTAVILLGIDRGFTPEVIVQGVIQGVIIAAVAVFGNEVLKQAIHKRLVDKGK